MTAVKYEKIEDVPERFNCAFEAAAANSLFVSRPWFTVFSAEIPREDQKMSIYASDSPGSGELTPALLPAWEPGPGPGLLRPRQLRSLTNYYSSLFSPVIDFDAGGAKLAVRDLVGAIVDDDARWDVVGIHPLEQDGPAIRELEAAFRQEGWLVQTYYCFGNWYLPTEGLDFETYWQTRPKVIRKNVPRLHRKFMKEPDARIEIITSPDELAAGLVAYWQVYRRRWSRPEPYPDFISRLAEVCAREGSLRLALAWLGDQPVAAQFWIVRNGVASIFKVGYDPEFKALSAGSVLTMKMIEHVLELGDVREIDYLTGDDDYKKHWMSCRRERWGLAAYNPKRPRGLLAGVVNIGGRAGKKIWGRLVDR